jgi:hypothetical protein
MMTNPHTLMVRPPNSIPVSWYQSDLSHGQTVDGDVVEHVTFE